jgi:hypothetical protein
MGSEGGPLALLGGKCPAARWVKAGSVGLPCLLRFCACGCNLGCPGLLHLRCVIKPHLSLLGTAPYGFVCDSPRCYLLLASHITGFAVMPSTGALRAPVRASHQALPLFTACLSTHGDELSEAMGISPTTRTTLTTRRCSYEHFDTNQYH